MRIATAHQILDKYYEIAQTTEMVRDNVAWALYQTWRCADLKRMRREERGEKDENLQ